MKTSNFAEVSYFLKVFSSLHEQNKFKFNRVSVHFRVCTKKLINLKLRIVEFGLKCTFWGGVKTGYDPYNSMYEAEYIVSFYSTWEYITLVGTLVIVSYKFSACNYCLVQLFTCFCPFRNSAGFLLWSE